MRYTQPELKPKKQPAPEVSTSKASAAKTTTVVKVKTTVVPISLRKFVGEYSLEENKICWDIFGNACRFVFEGKLADGRQPNPDNLLIHPGSKEISMRPKQDCEVLPQYTVEGSEEEANLFALGLTLQFVLTKEEGVPLLNCTKNLHELTNEAWELITAVVSEKVCKTFEGVMEFDWWKFPPSYRKQSAKAAADKRVKSGLREIHEAKSKLLDSCL